MWWQALGAVRDFGRLHEIASILIRHGFGDMVQRVGLAKALERAGRALRWREPQEHAALDPPARLRRALEELGPTFVKLGQILATRTDLFPPEWIAEFGKLQDAAPVMAYADLLPQLTEDLGAAPEHVFSRLDLQPLAAASLAQVHRAWLMDGSAVILKIRRPGIRPVVEADLNLLKRLGDILEAEAPDLRRYRPREVLEQFALSLRRELDFAVECRNAERVARNFADQPNVVIPRIHWQWSGERLNVQEFIAGIAGRDLAALDAAGLDRKLLARRGADAMLKMMLEDGFFHADPHPGNLFYLADNRVAFIDFGMVGRLGDERRLQIVQLLHGLLGRDTPAVADVLLDWADDTVDINTTALKVDIDTFIDNYHGLALQKIRLGAMLSDLIDIVRHHGLALPPELALMFKAFVTLEGLGRQIDPSFDMVGCVLPFVERILLARYSPAALAQRSQRALSHTAGLLADLPQDLSQLLRAARRGKLQAQIEVLPLKQFGQQIDRAAARLALSIITAALIVGSAIVVAVNRQSAPAGFPSFGLMGFIAAAIGGVWVLLSIWRSKGKD